MEFFVDTLLSRTCRIPGWLYKLENLGFNHSMIKLVHRTIYFLVITLVINLGGWTFNKEAWADVLLEEQQSVSSNSIQSSAQSDEGKPAPSDAVCNHWCHAVGHFIGLFSHWAPVMLVFANGHSAQQPLAIPFSSPDGRFRPPQRLS
jgi:hypothetical protein